MDYALRCGIFGWRKREYISVSGLLWMIFWIVEGIDYE